MSDHMESQMQDMMERGEAWFDAICDMLDKHGFDVPNMLHSDILKHASFLETINNKDRELAQVKAENESLHHIIESVRRMAESNPPDWGYVNLLPVKKEQEK